MKTLVVDNSPENARIYEKLGVDRVFVDLEINGKVARQGHLNTVISRHSISDINPVREQLSNSDLLVRINPMNEKSGQEIEDVISAGADLLMLPMFKLASEVDTFVKLVAGRAKVVLLLETAEALARIDEILAVEGIDEIHIGLNDLHLSMNLDFMFELLGGPLVEMLSKRILAKGILLGIGGIARLGEGSLPAEVILKEHVRLGSTAVILSRTFKGQKGLIEEEFKDAHDLLKSKYDEFLLLSEQELKDNLNVLKKKVSDVLNNIQKNKKCFDF